ncbi:gluconokinase [Leifsonia sp. fls2-241-R2A-40a]|uniref:gluconokinase n=1 Tax=Leifsonia sp. fls2-241-R2A-40a TaxID=3040290 RepID=UPI003305F2CE
MSARAVVVMGVAGCGKSTVAALLADRLGWELLEGDALHPAANVERMGAGIPLTDDDRAPWLAAIAAWMDERLDAGRSVVVACSALAKRYRDVLRRDEVVFLHLTGTPELLAERLASREHHFMKAGMLLSQLETLEPPADDERHLTLDIAAPPATLVASAASALAA